MAGLFENEFQPNELPVVKKLRRFNDDAAAELVAIKNLVPLLDEAERLKFDIEISTPLTMAQKFAAWRARRKALQSGY